MNLAAYLAGPQALIDVQAALVAAPIEKSAKHRRLVIDERCIQYDAYPEHAWMVVTIAHEMDRSEDFASAACHYRETTSGFIVSDCCLAAADFMLKTGRTFTEAWTAARAAMVNVLAFKTFNYEWTDGADLTIKGIEEADLPAAIAAVLLAVAKCAEAK